MDFPSKFTRVWVCSPYCKSGGCDRVPRCELSVESIPFDAAFRSIREGKLVCFHCHTPDVKSEICIVICLGTWQPKKQIVKLLPSASSRLGLLPSKIWRKSTTEQLVSVLDFPITMTLQLKPGRGCLASQSVWKRLALTYPTLFTRHISHVLCHVHQTRLSLLLPLLISFPCPPPLPQKNHSLNAVLGLLAAGFISEARRSHRGLVNVLSQQNKQLNQLIM